MSGVLTRVPGWPPSERQRDCLVIVVASVVVTLLVRPFQNTPFLDDWVYAWSVENLLKGGPLLVPEWSNNINIAQILWGWLLSLPFGFSFVPLRISTWLVAVASLCGLYLMLRDLEVPRVDALLGTATLGVYPIFALLSVTFMTDVPFVSLTILASFAMVRAMKARSTPWLIAAAALASLAAGVRMVAIVTPVAMFLALVLSGDSWGRRNGRWAIALFPLAVFAAVCWWYPSHIFYSADLTGIGDTTAERISMLPFAVPLLPRMLGETLALMAGTVGLALLPLSIACLRPHLLRHAILYTVTLVLVLAALYAAGLRYPLPLMTGSTWALNELGGTSLLVPNYSVPPVSAVICWSALAVGAFSLATAMAAAMKRNRWTAGERFLILAMGGHFLLIALIWLINDRYAIVLVPYAIAVLLAARPQLHRRTAAVGLIMVMIVTVAGIRDHLSYNRALWAAVDTLNQAGVPERDINGGYMVNGWLQYVHPERAYRNARGNIEIPWVNGDNVLPYEIANEVAEGSHVLQTFGYERWLGPSGHIYVLRRGHVR
jgi:4-amino-4-deoxy-L-arabinose transferase-like glycosyltransferase